MGSLKKNEHPVKKKNWKINPVKHIQTFDQIKAVLEKETSSREFTIISDDCLKFSIKYSNNRKVDHSAQLLLLEDSNFTSISKHQTAGVITSEVT